MNKIIIVILINVVVVLWMKNRSEDEEEALIQGSGELPNRGNGGKGVIFIFLNSKCKILIIKILCFKGPGYVWTQVLSEVEVRIPIKAGFPNLFLTQFKDFSCFKFFWNLFLL